MALLKLYVKLDIDYYEDDKILGIDAAAEVLYIRTLCYCKRTLNDGQFGLKHLRFLGLDNIAPSIAQLVAAGLWVETETGWVIPSWLKHNPSAEQVEDVRQMRRTVGKLGGRPPGKASGKQSANQIGNQIGNQTGNQNITQSTEYRVQSTEKGRTAPAREKFDTADVTTTKDDQTEADLGDVERDALPVHPGFDIDARMAHYRTLKAKHRRRHNDLSVQNVLLKLHTSRAVRDELGEQLTAGDVDTIVTDWLTRGKPTRVTGLFTLAPWDVPWWQVCLNGKGEQRKNPKQDTDTRKVLDEW